MSRSIGLVVVVVLGAFIAWAVVRAGTPEPLAASPVAAPTTTTIAPPAILAEAPMPLANLDGWLQSDVSSLDELKGQVVIVQFWTFGCRNCKATLDNMKEIYATHRDDGLEIVGVHAPEFDFEAEIPNIEAAAADLGVTWPIALDTTKQNFHAWQEGRTGYWPRTYVLDREGRIRYDHIGEGHYQELKDTVAFLLSEGA